MIHKIITPTPFAVGDVNAYVVKGDALSIVDVGTRTPEAYEALRLGLKQLGYTFKDIEQVILTHHHPDHAGWVDAFDNAEVLGHAYNDFWLKRDQAFFDYHDAFYKACLIEEGVPEQYLSWVERMKRPIAFMGERPLTQILTEGDDLPGHPGWKVMETLGHAQSHLAFWHEQQQTLIGGDLLLEKVSSNPLIEPPMDKGSARPKSLLQYNASLERLLTLPIKIVYGGHGNEVHGVHELVTERLQHQKERAMKVFEMVKEQPKTIYELTTELFPVAHKKELGLTLSETIGQVDYLMAAQLFTEKEAENGVLYYAQS